MKCNNCMQINRVPSGYCNVYTVLDSDIIYPKIDKVLKALNLNFDVYEELSSYIINLRVDSCLDFLNKLKDRSNFSEVGKENIQMSILDKEENFGLFSLKRMKLLDY